MAFSWEADRTGGRIGNGDDGLLLCPSALPKLTLRDAARSLARLIWVSEPQEGNCRATLVTAEQDLALGHPSLTESLAELCHQKLIPPSKLEESLSREDALYPAWGLTLTYSHGTLDKSLVLVLLYVV